MDERLPKASDWVCIERPDTTDNRNLLNHCLGNEHAVEWVTMMQWQNRNCRCMVHTQVDQRYVAEILSLARQYHVGTLCFKTFGAGKLLGDTSGYNQRLHAWPGGMHHVAGPGPLLPHLSVEQCLHYTLTCDPDVALLGLSDPVEQDAAFGAAQAFSAPRDSAQMVTIRQLAVAAVAHKGPCRWNPSDAPLVLAAVGIQ